MQRALLVLNPVAGARDPDASKERLEEELRRHFDLRVALTTKDCDADVCARSHRDDVDLVIAAGGDGTVSLVAGVLAGSKLPLGIIPLGTSNSIADGLGIPKDVPGAIATLVAGHTRAIDTARANGRMMVLHASIGFHAATVAGTPRDAKNRWGLLAYLKEGLVELTNLTEFKVELETENALVRCRAVNVTAANIAPPKTILAQGPAAVAPDDGELAITIVAASSLVDVVATGLHLLRSAQRGEAATRDNIGYLFAKKLRLTTDPPQPLLVDGEAAGTGHVAITCMKRDLVVVAPKVEEAKAPKVERLEGLPDLEVEGKGPP